MGRSWAKQATRRAVLAAVVVSATCGLGMAAAAPARASSRSQTPMVRGAGFAFAATIDPDTGARSALRWDRCAALIAVQVTAPVRWQGEIRSAVAQLGRISGLPLAVTVTGTAVPRTLGEALRGVGTGGASIRVVYDTRRDAGLFPAGDGPRLQPGLTYTASTGSGASARLYQALVLVDPSQVTPTQRRAVLRHELGHALGLQHVADPHALMSPVLSSDPVDLARDLHGGTAGDLAGLRAAGRGPCLTTP